MLQGASLAVFANDTEETAKETAEETAEEETPPAEAWIVNDGSAELVYADESQLQYAQLIRYPFLDTGRVAYEWSFPYSDRFFDIPSSQFSMTTAQGSLGLALSAFRANPKVVGPQYETYLTLAGFHDFYSFGYDQPTTEDSLSGIIAMKDIHGSTVIAVVTCGQGYKNEWAGNMKIGKGERHEGFNYAAGMLEDYLKQYIDEHGIDGSKKLWITGISRAAAIANLTAADAIESGGYDDVYAYLFGVPRVTKKPVRYSGIYNICGQYDAVSSIPLQSWGYERYGIDMYTPAQESDVMYPELSEATAAIGDEIDGKGFRNNPEVNYQLRLMIEFMDEFFKDSDEYADRFQDIMAQAVVNRDQDELIEALTEAFRNLPPQDRQEKRSITTFIDYLSFIAAQHMRADQRQINTGAWDTSESLASNLMLEHRPSTYVKWLFADISPEYLFSTPVTSRRVSIIGKVGVMVYEDDEPISAIDKDGNVLSADPNVPDNAAGIHGVFMMRNGEETVISLPMDAYYNIEVFSEGIRQVSYLEVPVTPEKLVPKTVTMYMGQIRNGSIVLRAEPHKALSEPEAMNGSYYPTGNTEYRYSPSVIMRNDLEATQYSYLSLGTALRLVRYIAGTLILLILVCLIIDIVHRRKVKNGHPPYSDLYVIVPHLICIVIFALLTQFVTFYLFTIKTARAQVAALTMLFIALLALRGAIRSRDPMAFLISAAMFIMVKITSVYYNNLPIDDTFSRMSMIIFFLLVAMLTTIAIWLFPDRGKRVKNNRYASMIGIKPASETPAEEKAPEKKASEKETSDRMPDEEKKSEKKASEKKASEKKTSAKKKSEKKTSEKEKSGKKTSEKMKSGKKTSGKKSTEKGGENSDIQDKQD